MEKESGEEEFRKVVRFGDSLFNDLYSHLYIVPGKKYVYKCI